MFDMVSSMVSNIIDNIRIEGENMKNINIDKIKDYILSEKMLYTVSKIIYAFLLCIVILAILINLTSSIISDIYDIKIYSQKYYGIPEFTTIIISLSIVYKMVNFKFLGKISTKFYVGLIVFNLGHVPIIALYIITNDYSGPGTLSGLILVPLVILSIILYFIGTTIFNNIIGKDNE